MATKTETREVTSDRARDRLREQVDVVGKDLKSLGGVAREAAIETIDDAREVARERYEDTRRRAESELDRLAQHIKDRPLQSVAIATGVGVLLGLLFFRRR